MSATPDKVTLRSNGKNQILKLLTALRKEVVEFQGELDKINVGGKEDRALKDKIAKYQEKIADFERLIKRDKPITSDEINTAYAGVHEGKQEVSASWDNFCKVASWAKYVGGVALNKFADCMDFKENKNMKQLAALSICFALCCATGPWAPVAFLIASIGFTAILSNRLGFGSEKTPFEKPKPAQPESQGGLSSLPTASEIKFDHSEFKSVTKGSDDTTTSDVTPSSS